MAPMDEGFLILSEKIEPFYSFKKKKPSILVIFLLVLGVDFVREKY
jgi:hypothetical protein